jgi:hypothetical protein
LSRGASERPKINTGFDAARRPRCSVGIIGNFLVRKVWDPGRYILASPLRTEHGLPGRPVIPFRPHVGADDPALGADRFRAQIPDRRIIRPVIGVFTTECSI